MPPVHPLPQRRGKTRARRGGPRLLPSAAARKPVRGERAKTK
jgi:hypothetical protein